MLVLTNRQLVDAVVGQLPGLPLEHVIGEPFKRDTAPCIAVAASLVCAADPEGTMVVMPSDHVIESKAEFHRAIRAGLNMVEQSPSRIVTFGIRPTYPLNRLVISNAGMPSKAIQDCRISRGAFSGETRSSNRRRILQRRDLLLE